MDINITDYLQLIYKITNKFPEKYREDLVNELYIKIHDLKDGYDHRKGKFTTYLYKRLYYTCIDYINQNRIVDYNLQELIKDDDNREVEKCELLESSVDEEKRYEDRDYLEKLNERFTPSERFIRTKYYELGLTVRMIIDLYSPIHGITSKTTIYKILNKK